MPRQRQISGGSSAPSTRERGCESPASSSRFADKAERSDCRGQKGSPISSTDLRAQDCQTCTRFDLPEREPFVGPEVVADYIDFDAETVVRFARLGYLPAHSLHVVGKRTHWRFLLSEVRAAMLSRTNTYSTHHQDQRT